MRDSKIDDLKDPKYSNHVEVLMEKLLTAKIDMEYHRSLMEYNKKVMEAIEERLKYLEGIK